MPTKFKNINNRIVGGFETGKPLPYQLALRTPKIGVFEKSGCGGILISSKFGITADHCIDYTPSHFKITAVYAGAYKYERKPFPAGDPCASDFEDECGVSFFC